MKKLYTVAKICFGFCKRTKKQSLLNAGKGVIKSELYILTFYHEDRHKK